MGGTLGLDSGTPYELECMPTKCLIKCLHYNVELKLKYDQIGSALILENSYKITEKSLDDVLYILEKALMSTTIRL
jgi:hypothetical protein